MTIADDMKAALPALEAQHGLTSDQVNAIVSQAVAPIQTTITGILSSEKSDSDKIADITAAFGELTTAFAPVPVADSAHVTPVADSTPVAPSPAPVVDSAPATPAPDATPAPAA